MNPIIAPETILFISFLNSFDSLLTAVAAVSLILFIGSLPAVLPDPDHEIWKQKEIEHYKKIAKWAAVIFIVSVVLKLLIPPEKTMYAMVAAQMFMPDNLNALKKTIIEIIKAVR